MAKDNTSLEQLKSFLNVLFQFDSQDLDFGVYKILHYKRKEIAAFIDQLLVDKVKAELQSLSAEETKQLQDKIAELEKDDIIKGWLEADETEKETLFKYGKEKIEQYQALKLKATESSVSVETENQIYNHLTLFFSRYYDKGDFVSKRRFGKNEKYVVPYNGEETHFHWANQDQYYIKSSETFSHYAFKVQTASGNLVVNFKLHNAQLEQGNVKAEEANFFVLSDKSPELNKQELTVFFEYRPLTEAEKKKTGKNGKQDSLDELAFAELKDKLSSNPLLLNLWKPVSSKAKGDEEGTPLLLQKLHHYTRKNKHDFFIHKNLKGFLERELDYYIKSELVNIDDLYVTDTDAHFDRLRHNLKTIKVFKSIADTIIDFVSQIEDFQKKLWEKKKFVLSTEWVITIDRLVEYVGEEAAKPILQEVINNNNQVAEWKELFGDKKAPKTIEELKADLHTWRKLPIDTGNFSKDFRINLLNILSSSVNLEEKSNGFVQQSDNFHGLKTLSDKYNSSIQSIYIDPPYNTSASEIIYKNCFKHSSWISFIANRLAASKDLLNESGILCVTIDSFELNSLLELLKTEYPEENNLGLVSIVNNPSGRSTVKGVSIANEFAIFISRNEGTNVGFLPRTEEQEAQYPESDENGKYQWRSFLRAGGANDFKTARPKLHYPIVIEDSEVRVPELEWDDNSRAYQVSEDLSDKKVLYPTSNGVEYTWRLGISSFKERINDVRFRVNRNGNETLDIKFYADEIGVLPKTVWGDKKYNATAYGTTLLKNVLGGSQLFSFPKSVYAVVDCIRVANSKENDIVLDYFPGSGTTFHATQFLNKEDEGNRKCILIEQGEYIYSVIIPRIKKIAYSFDWKDGKPKPLKKPEQGHSMNGLGVFFKYQRLEQYEEALENIAFNASENAVQQALEFDQYIPKYFLEFETKGSQTLVNTTAMKDPWDYKLKVWDGFTYDTEQAVDLVETFNYLIGLHMQKCITKEFKGKKYQFVYGHNNANKNILVVWRSVKDWSLDDYQADAEVLQQELENFEYDLLYINDQAHIEDYQPIEEVFKNKMLP